MKKTTLAFLVCLFAVATCIGSDFLPPPPGSAPAGAVTSGTGSLSLSTTSNSNQFVLNSDGSVTHNGASGQQAYQFTRQTSFPYVLAVTGKTAGTGSEFSLFSNDGDATDATFFVAYGKGTVATASSTFERLFWGWNPSTGRMQIKSDNGGGGTTTRALELLTDANTNQLTLNPDGTITFAGTTSQQDYLFTRNSTNRMALQGQSSGLASAFYLFPKDGDGTDSSFIAVSGNGTPTSADNDHAFIGWDLTHSQYEVRTGIQGAGTSRPLALGTSSVHTTILLNTNGSVIIGDTGETDIHRINTTTQAPSAGVLTLTNGPGASTGNPAVYLTLNINGTNYAFPGWAF